MMISARKRLAFIFALLLAFMVSVLAFAFTLTPVKADITGRMVDGASIRYGEDRPGIRFSTYVSDSYFTDGKLNDGVEVGMLLVQADKGTEADLTLNTTNQNVKKVSSKDAGFVWVTERDSLVDVDGYQRYNVVVTDIPKTAEAYGTEIIAISYIKVGDNNPEYAINPQTRSIARVANQILAEDAGNDTISAREPETLKGYAFATESPKQSNVDNRFFHLDGENLVWGTFDGAIGYYVCINGQSIFTAETSIELSKFNNPVGKATLVAFGNGVDYSYSTVETCFVIDSSETIKGVSNGGYLTRATDARGLKSAEYSVENGAVEVKVDTLNSARFAPFRLELADALNFTENVGVKIKFMVVEQPFESASLTFVADNGTWNDSGVNNDKPSVEVVEGEWQVLSLTNAQLDTMLNNGDEYITLCVMKKSAEASNGVVKVLVDGVYAYNVLETPTNLVVENGVASWSAVANADGYVVSFNGEEQEVVTETSFDLFDLIGSNSAYSVKVKAVANAIQFVDSAYCDEITVLSEPENVLASFNNSVYTKMVSKAGANNILNSATYLEANANDGYGGHDGAVEITLDKTGYGYMQAFQVALSKKIDATENSLGVKVRLRVVSAAVPESITELKVYLGEINADDNREYAIREGNADAVFGGTATIGGEWTEVIIPSSALKNALSPNEVAFDGTSTFALMFAQTGANFRNKTVSQYTVIQIDYIEYINEPANVLASFNNELYVNNIVQLDPDSTISKVEFLEANDEHDGAVQITINQATYTYMPMFMVNLANTLDLTNNSKVKVRMRVMSLPITLADTETIRAYVGYEMPTNPEYTSVRNDIADRSTALKLGEWAEITIPKTAYNLVDLYDGTKTLGLGIGFVKENGDPKGFSSTSGKVVIQIDYIEYVQG